MTHTHREHNLFVLGLKNAGHLKYLRREYRENGTTRKVKVFFDTICKSEVKASNVRQHFSSRHPSEAEDSLKLLKEWGYSDSQSK